MQKINSDKALTFAKKALIISDTNKDLNNYLLNLNQLGRIYYHFQYYKKAIETYNKGIDKYDENWDNELTSKLSNLYSNSSAAYEKLGLTEKSIQVILKGIDIAEKTNNLNQKAYGLYALGYKYMDLKNYSKAEKFFLNSLSYSDSVSLQSYIYMNHHGLGINYSRWGKYDKALYHNKMALNFFRKQGDKLYEFDVLNNTAVVYERINKPDSILKYANLALDIAKDLNHKLAINGAKITLSNAYLKLKKYDEAKKVLLEVAKDTIDSKIIDKNSKASIYSNLSEIYEGQQNFKKSLEYHKKFKSLNDSIEKEIHDSKLLDTESKYQLEQKNNTILSQKLKISKREKEKTRLIFALILFALALLTLSYFLYLRIKQIKIEQNKYSKEVIKVKKLENSLQEKVKIDKVNYKEQQKNFQIKLKEKYTLTDAIIEYWMLQVHGVSEKEMQKQLNLSESAIKSRRKRLYEKLKELEGIDQDMRFSKSESTKIYRKNQQDLNNLI